MCTVASRAARSFSIASFIDGNNGHKESQNICTADVSVVNDTNPSSIATGSVNAFLKQLFTSMRQVRYYYRTRTGAGKGSRLCHQKNNE